MTTSFTSAFRGALRALRRRPGFFAIAVSSIGVALGLSTAVFAMIDALRHPLASNDGIERVFDLSGGLFRTRGFTGSRELEENVAPLPGIEAITAHTSEGAWLDGGSHGQRRSVHKVLPNYARVLGLRAARGRLLASDDFPAARVAVVSDNVWRSHFNNRDDLAGAVIALDAEMYTVIGVLAPHAQAADALVPAARGTVESCCRGLYALKVRLRPGWSRDRMHADLAAIEARLVAQHGRGPSSARLGLRSIRPEPLEFKDFHFAMLSAAIGILLIACANVAALMLARGVSNRRDYALHLALGAKPIDLTRGVIAEVTVIAVCGALAGAFVAKWATQILTVSVPENLNNLGLSTPQWSVRVFALAFCAMLAAIALAAAAPAWYAARTNPQEPLKDSAGTTTGRASTRFRALVMTEMAVSMVLLFGASLMAKSILQVAFYDFGYDPDRLLKAYVAFPNRTQLTPRDRQAAAQGAVDRIRALPGITHAALYTHRHPDSSAVITEQTATGGPQLAFSQNDVYTATGPGFFDTFGIRMVSGRDFTEGDRIRGAIVLSEGARRALFPRGDAIGRLVKLGAARSDAPWYPVIGVVRDLNLYLRDPNADVAPAPDIYAFLPDSNPVSVSIVAQTIGSSERLAVELRHMLQDLSPAGSGVSVNSWHFALDRAMRAAKFAVRLFVMLGLSSLVLAAAGLFSVLSYVVSQRMREFAVRMALGAREGQVVGLVVRDAMVMALGGTAIGAAIGMWGAFFIWDLLFAVYPVDAPSLIVAEVTLLLATLVACVVPAVRAARANPLDVMRAT